MAKKKAAAQSSAAPSTATAHGAKAEVARKLIAEGKRNKDIVAEMAAQGMTISGNYLSYFDRAPERKSRVANLAASQRKHGGR